MVIDGDSDNDDVWERVFVPDIDIEKVLDSVADG